MPGLALVIGLGYSWLNAARAAQPTVGQAAPAFRLQDQNGNWVALEDFRGKWIAVYFYPKADTPGCTKEACEFRDNIFAFEEIGATIIGISIDAIKDQKKFAEKYSLPFPLLADIDGKTAEAYGVLNNLGIMKIAKRQSFLIGPDGRIARHYEKVDPATHSKEVLADLKALGAAGTGRPRRRRADRRRRRRMQCNESAARPADQPLRVSQKVSRYVNRRLAPGYRGRTLLHTTYTYKGINDIPELNTGEIVRGHHRTDPGGSGRIYRDTARPNSQTINR